MLVRALRWLGASLAVALCLVVLATTEPGAQGVLPDVAIRMTMDVRDVSGWLVFYDEILATPSDAAQPVKVTIGTRTGAMRSIVITRPNLDVKLPKGRELFRVVMSGKLSGAEALYGLSAFQRAVVEANADHHVVLSYGLSTVDAQLVEVVLNRP